MSESLLLLKSLPKIDSSINIQLLQKKNPQWKIKSCLFNPTILNKAYQHNNFHHHHKQISCNFLIENKKHDLALDTLPDKTIEKEFPMKKSLINSMKEKKTLINSHKPSSITHNKNNSNLLSHISHKSTNINSSIKDNEFASLLSCIRPYDLRKEYKVTKVLKTTIKLKSLMNTKTQNNDRYLFALNTHDDLEYKQNGFTSPQLSKHERQFQLDHNTTYDAKVKNALKINSNPIKDALIIKKNIKQNKFNDNTKEELRQKYIMPILNKNKIKIFTSYKEVEGVMNQITNVFQDAKDEISNQTENFNKES